jgi:hypothetical protein
LIGTVRIKGKAVDVPAAFSSLAISAHPDFLRDLSPDVDLLDYLVRGMRQHDRIIAAAFIDKLLAQDLPKGKLSKIWRAAGADTYTIASKDIVPFLTCLRDRLYGERGQ